MSVKIKLEEKREQLAKEDTLPGAFKRGYNACLTELFPKYEKAIRKLTAIADSDYRGNRPLESVIAHEVLVELGERK